MTIQQIDIGTTADDGTGDTIRAGGALINANFEEISDRLDSLEARPVADVHSVAGVAPVSGNIPALALETALSIPRNPEDVHAATEAQGAKADSAIQPAALNTALALKVDKVAGYGLSQTNFTQAEKDKLAALDPNHFRGTYATIGALNSAVPIANVGDYAYVDPGTGQDVMLYLWDSTDNSWVLNGNPGGGLTAAQVKVLYESNPDTNPFDNAAKSKLQGIATGATQNSPDATLLDRANHTGTQTASTISNFASAVLSTLLSGLNLTVGTAISAADSVLSALGKLQKQLSDHVGSGGPSHSPATTSYDGFMSSGDKAKLDGVATGATANATNEQLRDRSTHTGTQTASTISNFASAVLNTVLSGIDILTLGTVQATDTVLSGLGKLQAQATLLMSSTQNVVKYGVVADDPSKASANDAAIAAAIAAGAKGLYFPAGIYYLNNIQVPAYFRMVGDGHDVSILSFVQANRTTRTNMLTSAGAISGFIMRDIQLRGNRAFQTTASVTGQDCAAIYFRSGSVSNVFIEDCSFRQFGDSVSTNVGGAIILGALTGTNNIVANIHIRNNFFTANGNIPAIYINCDANYHNALLCRNVHLCANNINVNVGAAHNAIYFLGGNVANPAWNLHIEDNDFYVSATIDTLIEVNYAMGFAIDRNKATITGSATVVGLLVRDSIAYGTINGNSLVNLGTGCTTTNGISAVTLGSAAQSNLTISHNQVKGWAMGGIGKGIAVLTTSANVKVSQNYVGGNSSSSLTSVGISVANSSNTDVFDNTLDCCTYALEIGPVDGLRFIRNTLISVGDGTYSAISGSGTNMACTHVQIMENKVKSRNGSTASLVTLSAVANTGNRIERNYLISPMSPVNDSSRASFEAIVIPSASGTLIAGDVYRFSQGSVDVTNGTVVTLGANLDGTLDAVIGGACSLGDSVIVSPPGDVGGCVVSATVTASNRVRVKLANMSGSGASIVAGNWTVIIVRSSRM